MCQAKSELIHLNIPSEGDLLITFTFHSRQDFQTDGNGGISILPAASQYHQRP